MLETTTRGEDEGVLGTVQPDDQQKKEQVIERVARLGMPFVAEEDSQAMTATASAGRSTAEADPLIRHVTIQASQLLALGRLGMGGDLQQEGRKASLDVGTEMDWNAEESAYTLSKLRLELLGDRLWIVRDLRPDAEENWSLGVQFKRTW